MQNRSLSAIMFTDVVGYTTLTGRDEAKAAAVRDRHRSLVRSLAGNFRGRLVDATGDETLSVFPSAVLAVDCAVALQAALRGDPELRIRIGLHLGDVLQSADEVMGEGVNVASRIRPVAEPGGICVSEAIYRQIHNQPHIHGRSLGKKSLKNVGDRMEIFAISSAGESALPRPRRRWKVIAIATTCLAVVLGYTLWIQARVPILAYVALNAPRYFGRPVKQRLGFATTSDGVRIAYATSGEGPPLLFVLGWATHLERGISSPLYDASGWLSRFSAERLFVRYDGRGFGLSDRDVSDFSLEARVRDLTAVVEALALERFDLYAVSAGGPTAVAYAAAHPEKIAHLVLAGSGIAGFTDDAMGSQIRDLLPVFSAGWQSPMVRKMFAIWIAPDAGAVEQEVVSEFLRVSSDGPSVEGFLGALFEIDVRDQAKHLRVPTLVVHGTDDRVIPLRLGREAASTIPGARFEILEDAGHFEDTLGSERLRELIEEFLRQ